jgi:carbonic anhydrase
MFSSHVLGVRELMIVEHTGCGMEMFSEEDFEKIPAQAIRRLVWTPTAKSQAISRCTRNLIKAYSCGTLRFA